MADQQLNISVKVVGDDPKRLKATLKELTQEIKAVELGFKSGVVTQQQASQSFQNLANRIKATGASELQLVDITQRLWHANNRVEIGFKSLASETINANRALRQINQEQKLGNQLLGSLSGIIGGPAAGVIGQFQMFEDAALRSGVALQSAGAKGAAFGSMLMGLATPVAGFLAVGGLVWMRLKDIDDRFKAATASIRDMKIELGLVSKEDAISDIKKQIDETTKKLESLRKENENYRGRGSVGVLFGASKADVAETESQILSLEVKKKSLQEQLDKQYMDERERALTQGVQNILDIEKKAAKESHDYKIGLTAKSFAGPSFAFSPESPEAMEAGLRGVAAQRRRVGGRGFGAGVDQYDAEIRDRTRQAAAVARGEAQSTFAQIGQDAITSIGGNLVRAFAMGEEAVRSFGSLAQSILGTLITGLFTWIGSMIPGAGGVIVSSLGSGLGGALGGSAPSIGGTPRGNAPIPPQIIIKGDFGYDKLAFAVDRGNQMRSLRK